MASFLNHVAISAPRNASFTHTVSPSSGTVVGGSYFTPTVGRFLLVIVEGGVTTFQVGTPGQPPLGWTVVSEVVGNTGLYAYVKTAAGADTIAMQHNGSNYPVVVDFYEFPAGTTYVAEGHSSVSKTGTNTPITGLTGTKFCIAAKDQGVGLFDATSYSAVWDGASVESIDVNVAGNVTDGCYLTVSYSENWSSATYAPTATVTSSNSTSCEVLSVALDVPPTSGVTYTKVHDSRPANNGASWASGDYTTASFTVAASKLLLLVVHIASSNVDTRSLPYEIPTPVTSGLTWIKKIGADFGAASSFQGVSIVAMWLADSGAGGSITVSQTGSGTAWDSGVSALDVTVYECSGAEVAANQNGVTGLGGQFTSSTFDPGAQSIDLSGPPSTGSYVFAAAAMFTSSTGGVTPGSDFTEVAERLASSSGPYLLSQVQARTGSASPTIAWVDLQTGTADVNCFAVAACEILASGASSPAGTLIALTEYGAGPAGLTNLTTPVFRPPPNSTLYVFTALGSLPPASFTNTFSGGGLTYSPVTVSAGSHTFGSSFNHYYQLHSAVVGSSPSEMQVTFDPINDASTTGAVIVVVAVVGTPTLKQPATNASTASNTTSQTVTLGSAATTGSLVLAMFGCNNDTPLSTSTVPTDGGTWGTVANEKGWNTVFLSLFYKTDFTGTSVTSTVAATVGGSRGGVIVELWIPPPTGTAYNETGLSIPIAAAVTSTDLYRTASGLYTDNFNRADTTTLLSGGYGLNGVSLDWSGDGWQISSNKAYRTGAGSDYVTFASTLGMPDMFVEADYDRSGGAYCVVNARRPSATNVETGYLAYIDPGGGACHIAKSVAGSFSSISGGDFTAGAPYPATGRIRLECLGTLLTLKIDGVTIGSTNDSTITSGNYAGMNGSSLAVMDNFAIGGISTPVVTTLYTPLVQFPLLPMGG